MNTSAPGGGVETTSWEPPAPDGVPAARPPR
jgi:hypothetical protein